MEREAVLSRISRYALPVIAALLGLIALMAAETNGWVAAVAVVIVLLPSLFISQVSNKLQPSVPAETVTVAADPLAEVKSAFSGFDSAAFLLDPDGNVIYENPAALHLFGEIEAGQHISGRMRTPALMEMIRKSLASGRTGQTEYSPALQSESVYQVRCIRADATLGKTDFYILIFRDISESRRIDRMRTDFVANASHELRTPLASLRGFIETLLGPARNDPAAHERFLTIMLEQVTRMSRLVDDLMSLSRLELKARLAPDSQVDLVPLIGSVCDALAPLAADVDVTIHVDVPDHPVIVPGDRDELTQVFENLIENACKYGQEGKTVEVVLDEDGPEGVEVGVTDHGQGIAEDHVPRLTERFYRVNVESSRTKKGTGLGLAIVKHILTRHKARLIIRSEIGKGSTFTVRF